MRCVICDSECSGEGVLTDGSVFHYRCHESLAARIATLGQAPPRSQLDAELDQQVAILNHLKSQLHEESSILARARRGLTGKPSPEAGIRSAIIKREQRVSELQEATRVELAAHMASASQERTAVVRRLSELYDRWPTYPPDWDSRTAAARGASPVCSECGAARALHVHHMVPLGQGGTNRSENLSVLCERCHSARHGGADLGGEGRAVSQKFEEKVRTIQAAIDQGSCIRFRYRKWEGDTSTRTIRPDSFSTVGSRDSLCVSGYCYLRHEDRIFAVRRMNGIRVVDDPN